MEICIKFMHFKFVNKRVSIRDGKKFHIEPELALEVLKAAIYLQCWETQIEM